MKNPVTGHSVKKGSLASVLLSLSGVLFLFLRDIEIVKRHGQLSRVLLLLAVLGYLGGVAIGIGSLTTGKLNKLTSEDKVQAWLGTVVGLLGLAYIVLANYLIFRLRHV